MRFQHNDFNGLLIAVTSILSFLSIHIDMDTHCNLRLSYEENLCSCAWWNANACLQVVAVLFNAIPCVLLYICWTEGSKITFLQMSICQWCSKFVECIQTEKFPFMAVDSNWNRNVIKTFSLLTFWGPVTFWKRIITYKLIQRFELCEKCNVQLRPGNIQYNLHTYMSILGSQNQFTSARRWPFSSHPIYIYVYVCACLKIKWLCYIPSRRYTTNSCLSFFLITFDTWYTTPWKHKIWLVIKHIPLFVILKVFSA